jgi:hypothetical protein
MYQRKRLPPDWLGHIRAIGLLNGRVRNIDGDRINAEHLAGTHIATRGKSPSFGIH